MRAKYAEYMRNMGAPTFGELLGNLVRQKRRAQGLTQIQLAEDAFGTSAKTRRISELESGSVANPHHNTIDPIIVALRITQAELDECARLSITKPDPDLDRAYREARNLIEAIARQFENDDPDASLAELDCFLRAKSAEWVALRRRIESLDNEENAIAEIKIKANNALDAGNFEIADSLLQEAEVNFQKNRTLIEIRKLASIKISRGDIAFLRSD